MIIPFLDGFMTFSRAPITWILVLLNVFLFSQNHSLSKDCQEQFEVWYSDQDFLYTQGQIYKQFNQKRDIAKVSDLITVGRLAFRDEGFLKMAVKSQWQGDQVAILNWQTGLQDFLVLRAYYPPLLLGVSSKNRDFFSFISYQFFHEGFYHLLGNILLILIVGGFLEQRYSGLLVFSVYLVGGWLAALSFTLVGGASGAPLVGASGSLCALLGFLFILEMKTKTRLFYMFLPARPYFGFVFVPTLYWVLWLCMVEDISGVMRQPSIYSSGVAHLVHIFGFLGGVGLAISYAWYRKQPFYKTVQL